MSAYILINSYINHGFCFSRTKINSLIPLNSNYHILKFVERNLDAYKMTVKENLLVLLSKAFAKRKALLFIMQHHIYTKRIGWLSII